MIDLLVLLDVCRLERVFVEAETLLTAFTGALVARLIVLAFGAVLGAVFGALDRVDFAADLTLAVVVLPAGFATDFTAVVFAGVLTAFTLVVAGLATVFVVDFVAAAFGADLVAVFAVAFGAALVATLTTFATFAAAFFTTAVGADLAATLGVATVLAVLLTEVFGLDFATVAVAFGACLRVVFA